ncbi:MAG: hypothetical protein ACK45Y_09180, partial [Betaproteobacteria bacterium]
ANLHGYRNYAEYALADTMAGTPAAVEALLNNVWQRASARARIEAQDPAHAVQQNPFLPQNLFNAHVVLDRHHTTNAPCHHDGLVDICPIAGKPTSLNNTLEGLDMGF